MIAAGLVGAILRYNRSRWRCGELATLSEGNRSRRCCGKLASLSGRRPVRDRQNDCQYGKKESPQHCKSPLSCYATGNTRVDFLKQSTGTFPDAFTRSTSSARSKRRPNARKKAGCLGLLPLTFRHETIHRAACG